jgi:hypothetical protein
MVFGDDHLRGEQKSGAGTKSHRPLKSCPLASPIRAVKTGGEEFTHT